MDILGRHAGNMADGVFQINSFIVSIACPSLVHQSMAEAFMNVEAAAAGLSGPLLLLLPAEHSWLTTMHVTLKKRAIPQQLT